MKYILLLALLITNIAQAQYHLGLNLVNGSSYFQRVAATLTIDEDINGQKLDINSTISAVMSFKVLGKSGSDYDLLCAYTEMGMTMKTPDGDVSFSSVKPADEKDVFSKILKNMINHQFHVTMQENGMIKEVKGIDSLWSNLMNDFPDLDETKKIQIVDQLKQSYGENSVRGNMEQLTAIFPDKKVNINDQWQNTVQLKTTMTGQQVNHFRLTAYNAQFAEIENHGDIKTNDTETQVNGMAAVYHLSGPTDSKIKIDTKTGWIIEAEIHQDLKGNVEIKDNPKIPGGITIPMELTAVSKVADK
jgi:uncharacterized protein DUF6263